MRRPLVSLMCFIAVIVAVYSLNIESVRSAGKQNEVDLKINGATIPITQGRGPYWQSDLLMVPLKPVVQSQGYSVKWDQPSQSIKVSHKTRNTVVVLRIGESTALVNKQRVSMISPTLVHQGMAYVPIDFIADLLESYWTHNEQRTAASLISISSTGADAYVKIRSSTGTAFTALDAIVLKDSENLSMVPQQEGFKDGTWVFDGLTPYRDYTLLAKSPFGEVPLAHFTYKENLLGLPTVTLPDQWEVQVKGTVVDEKGEAIPGSKVFVTDSAYEQFRREVTVNEAGVFQITSLVPGNFYRIYAEPVNRLSDVLEDSALPVNELRMNSNVREFVYRPDAVSELELFLPPVDVSGKVVDSTGRPLVVQASIQNMTPGGIGKPRLEVQANSKAYYVAGLAEGETYEMTVTSVTNPETLIEQYELPKPVQFVYLPGMRLPAITVKNITAFVTGRVVDQNDQPVEGVHILGRNTRLDSPTQFPYSARSDRNGNFTISFLTIGESYDFHFGVPGGLQIYAPSVTGYHISQRESQLNVTLKPYRVAN
ncbi:hypothetical protein FHS18_004612 [Paenibacillus phyllosphaerae]|uniref:Copper amine oxidase-like N-terminal domain-containing protein n=1 Tax=Paenibacillus phyllosphaerae TaxID=274593 RepID=A0A7W5FPM0_9BACL|nr:carboxypeptidase regulatory-like domain-containing protein [Paenibacillus phyllosphaerae]MBB3112511.1 hypothetical protein [Paenibacillus phyllosphaerae]